MQKHVNPFCHSVTGIIYSSPLNCRVHGENLGMHEERNLVLAYVWAHVDILISISRNYICHVYLELIAEHLVPAILGRSIHEYEYMCISSQCLPSNPTFSMQECGFSQMLNGLQTEPCCWQSRKLWSAFRIGWCLVR